MFKWIFILFLFPLWAQAQWTGGGLTPFEQCGNGVDDDSSGTFGSCPGTDINAFFGVGCDRLCPGSDKDNDGFFFNSPEDIDCDDRNRGIFPGESRRCTITSANDGWQICDIRGKFTTCKKTSVSPWCNASGAGKCYYVDIVNGNNSNNGLTPATAKANWLQFISYFSSGDKPSGWIQLVPGDSVIFMGGTYTTSFSYNGSNRMFNFESVSGTPDHPIRFQSYPGETVIFANSGTFSSGNQGAIVNLSNANYVQISGFTIKDGYGQGIKVSGSSGVKIYKNIIKDIDGDDTNNMGGILIGIPSISPSVEVFLNILVDNYDRTGSLTSGSRHIFASEGYGKIYRNTIFNTNTTLRKGMGVVLSKGNPIPTPTP